MSDELKLLLDAARGIEMSPEDKEEQRRSFAYGNSKIENDRITRRTIDEQAEYLKQNA